MGDGLVDISVRSYLTAGVAAVVGTTAIGLAPAQHAPDLRAVALPAPVVAEIALTGTSIPWETIAAVVKALSSGGSLQAGVSSLISSIGTEFAKEALPVITAAAGDVVKFVGAALADLLTGPGLPSIDFAAIIEAATAAISAGNLPGAIKTLTSALSAPLIQIGEVLFTPEFQDFIFTKVGTVLGAMPEILRTAVEKVVGLDIKPLIDMLSGLISKIIPGVIPPAAALTVAPRALAAAAAPVAAVDTAISPAPVDVPAAPEAAPADDAAAKAPAEAPAVAVAAAPDATPAADAAPETAPATEVDPETPVVTEVELPAVEVPVEAVAPVGTSSIEASEAAAANDAPAPVTRTAKSGARHASAKSADSGARG